MEDGYVYELNEKQESMPESLSEDLFELAPGRATLGDMEKGFGSDGGSFHSAQEDRDVNLYSHISCPILSSDILLNSYAKFLNHVESSRRIGDLLFVPVFAP